MNRIPSPKDVGRLREIREEIRNLLDEAKDLVRGTSEQDRAHHYWYAHARCALDDDHMYLGGSMTTMLDSIEALDVEVNEREKCHETD